MTEPAPPFEGLRVNGLVILGLLVAGGMGIGSVYYRIVAPGELARLRSMQAAVPTEAVPRLAAWMGFGAPMIHNRLQFLRLSRQQPWLVGFAVERAAGDPDIWGVDFSDLPRDLCVQEGLLVRLRLPPARILARTRLVGDNADRVPRYASLAAAPDPDARAAELVEWALRNPDDFIARLEREIPGATLVVEGGTYPGPGGPGGGE